MATSLTDQQATLLWLTEWGVWRSSENRHLYDQLRSSYHDHRKLEAAPGHLFLPHEAEDLATFLHVAMLNGWGGCFLPAANCVDATFNHDGILTFYASIEEHLTDVERVVAAPQPPDA